MLAERNVPEEWIWRTIDRPDGQETGTDGNIHYMKAIAEHDGRILRVIVNPNAEPRRVVTLFFDRRLRRQK